MSPARTLDELLIRAAISDVVLRYAAAVDGRDWDMFTSCFTDPVFINFVSFSPTAAEEMPRSAWVARVRSLIPGFDATQHLSSNHDITIATDGNATCVSAMQATHVLDDSIAVLGGFYTNQLVRAADRTWRIESCTLTVTWRTGDQRLFALARERASASG